MRMIVPQDETESGELANWLRADGGAVQVVVGHDAAGAEPPPVVPSGRVQRQARFRILNVGALAEIGTRLRAPVFEVGLRRCPALIRRFNQDHLEITD